MSERKKQIRFSEKDDLLLLREVLAKNPFKDRAKWTDSDAISRAGFTVDGRRVRERTNLLLEHHRKNDAESKKKSGVSEEYDEKTTLLDDILELKEEEERIKESEKEKKSADDQKGKDIRKRALENLSKDEDQGDQTPKKRNSTTNIMEYLQTKSNQESDYKKEELKVRGEELKLQRERFELEREERRERVETEKKEKALMLQLLQKALNQK
ncbi:uncharacterized protein LOC134272239 [Saccostrea cucullata]|uniref:uncharacterized protein LOC134272239 n=1 Tax=Saccostrea cuccullata TaxID=36930 RepID=UPI002ED3DF2C